MRIVISQSMYFPWVGFLEQIRLADVFVHYDDVQFSKGSFTNRVQIKTPKGPVWMTVPLTGLHLGQQINEAKPAPLHTWKCKHLDMLKRSFEGAPFADDAFSIAQKVLEVEYNDIGSLARASTNALIEYFEIGTDCTFRDIRELSTPGQSSERVHDVVKAMEGTEYITGHGARKYLDHDLFARSGIAVRYMDYKKIHYPQLHGEFTPYVSSLDLVANCGRRGVQYICSGTISSDAYLKNVG